MKRLTLLFFIISITTIANNKKTPSTLNEVTVYLNGAQITRTAQITISKGTTEFIFNYLSPNIEESSIQISGLSSASVLSINYGINYMDENVNTIEIEILKQQILLLNDKIQFENNVIIGFNEELQLIQSNRKLGNQTVNVSLEKLKAFSSYYRKRMTEINNVIFSSNKSIASYTKDIKKLKKQLQELNVTDTKETGEIKVKLNSEISESLNLTIKYNVTDAGWFPVYDLKAEKINAPLSFLYKAHIYQNSGLDWNNVKLTLSTSDPNTNNIKPELNSKYLNIISKYSSYRTNRAKKRNNYKYNPHVQFVSGIVVDESGMALPGVNIIETGTTNGTQSDFDGKYKLQINGGDQLTYSYVGMTSEVLPIHSSIMNVNMLEDAQLLEEVVVTAYSTSRESQSLGYAASEIKLDNVYGNRNLSGTAKGVQIEPDYTSTGDLIEEGITNTSFEIKKKHSISTGDDLTVIKINEFEVPAEFSYFAAPIINENVFLTAKFGNWEQYNLLPGEANIYFEGSYSGKTNINPQAITDSLTISLGVDPNVIVKRNQLNNFKNKSFTGSNKIINRTYEIELKNNKQSDISMILLDRIPMSQNKEIKIVDIETGTSNYDTKKGILEWKINLPSNSSKTQKFSYSVKYPKQKRINL